jgi:hypothetical protein
MAKTQLEIIYPLPESWGICLSCEMFMAQANLDQGPYMRGLEEYPPEWREEFQRLSDLILSLAERYPEDLAIRIWDPRSLQGMWKSLRHGVRRYPTFLVNGKNKISGWDEKRLEAELQTALTAPVVESAG